MKKLSALVALVAAVASLPCFAAGPVFSVRDVPEARVRQLNSLAGRVTTLEQGGGTGGTSGVTSVNTRTGAVTITSGDITGALGFSPQASLGFTPLNPANNLSEIVSPSTARTNLGLGSAATQATSSFLQASNNLVDLTNAGTARTNLGLGSAATQASSAFATASHTHAFTDIVSIPTGSLIYRKTAGTGAAETQTLATLKTDLGLTGTNSGDQTITLTGDVGGSGTGSFATTIGANRVTRSMLAATSGATVLGATAAGNVADLSGTQATTLLDAFTSSLKGLAPASGGGTTNFLRADGTWAAPPSGGGGTGTVTSVSVTSANGVSGSVATATTTPAISLTLGAITPSSVAATGNVTGSNLSGTNTGDESAATIKSKLGITTLSGSNTGDQTITLTGDATGSGTGSFATTLATVNSNVGSFGDGTHVPAVTVDGKGRITAVSSVAITSGSNPWTEKTLTADFTTTSVTQATITDGTNVLTFIPAANGNWEVELRLMLLTVTATVLPEVNVSVQAQGAGSYGSAMIELTGATVTSRVFQDGTWIANGSTVNISVPAGGLPAAATPYLCIITVRGHSGAAPGTINFQLASETAGTSVKVLAGSQMLSKTT